MTPHITRGHARDLAAEHKVSCFPVVGPEGEPVGIITAMDLLAEGPDGQKLSTFMTPKVYTVPSYEDPAIAARIMRNHHIHHVVVVDENKVVGILSSFDLLKLVEGHRWIPKNKATNSSRKGGKRNKAERP